MIKNSVKDVSELLIHLEKAAFIARAALVSRRNDLTPLELEWLNIESSRKELDK